MGVFSFFIIFVFYKYYVVGFNSVFLKKNLKRCLTEFQFSKKNETTGVELVK